MFTNRRVLCVVCFVTFLAVVSTASAQVNTATITGTVTDATGAVIAGATVTATSVQTGIQHSETTSEGGRYTIINLTPGFYDVQASQQGFSTVIRRNQEFLVGTTVTIDFTMQVATVAQTVEVTTAAPVIEATASDVSRVVQTSEVDNLPMLSRTYTSLAQLSPGVQVSSSGAVSSGDTGGFGLGYIVDGNSYNQFNGGGSVLPLAADWIQEFSVVTQQATAEYATATQGYVNSVLRSGSNTLHGRAYGYFTSSALNAIPAFSSATAIAAGTAKPNQSSQRVGGFIGGPIKTDKLFYFIGYEYFNSSTATPINIPAAFNQFGTTYPGIFPLTNTQSLGLIKLDYKQSESNQFHLTGNYQFQKQQNVGIATLSALSSGSLTPQQGGTYSVIWDHTLSPTELNELRASNVRYYTAPSCNQQAALGAYTGTSQFGVAAPYPNQITPIGDPTGLYASVQYTGTSVGTVSTGCFSENHNGEGSWYWSDTLSIVKGDHTMKFGLQSGLRDFYNINSPFDTYGQYTITTGSTPFNPATAAGAGGAPPATYPTTYSVYVYPTNGSGATLHIYDPFGGFFGQDSWKMKSDFTLNLGIRYDLDFSANYITVVPGLGYTKPSNDYRSISPRVGFAWTPFHDGGRTVIRGGVGIFYQQSLASALATYNLTGVLPARTASGVAEIFQPMSATVASQNPYCSVPASAGGVSCASGIPAANKNAVEVAMAYALATDTLPNFNPCNGAVGGSCTVKMPNGGPSYSVPVLTASAPPTSYDLPSDYVFPATAQITAGVARQLGENLGLSADFAYITGFDQGLFRNENISLTGQIINPNFSNLYQLTLDGGSRNYSLRIGAHDRDHRGDTIQVAYALSFASNDVPNFHAGSSATFGLGPNSFGGATSTDPFDPTVDWGPSDGVPRNNLTVSGVLRIPFGLQLAPIVTLTTGQRFTPTVSSSVPIPFAGSSFVAPCPVYYQQCAPTGLYGTKGEFVGANNFTVSARLSYRITIKERYSGTLMLEAFNLNNATNITNYNLVYTNAAGTALAPSFGLPTAAAPRRTIDAGFEFDF